jgi:hypothetical protein
MDFLEFLCGLFELTELISAVCETVAWLFRAPGRLARSIAVPYGTEGKGIGRPADGRTINHMSLTRRRRGKWRGASYVLR